MPPKLTCLTQEQETQLRTHVQEWMKKCLSAAPAPRAACEHAVRRAYELAGIAWHGRVIWTGSPLALELAGRMASQLAERRGRGCLSWALHGIVDSVAEGALGQPAPRLAGEVCTAVRAVTDALGTQRRRVVRASDAAVRVALDSALAEPLDQGVRTVVSTYLHLRVRSTIEELLHISVGWQVTGAVRTALRAALAGLTHSGVRVWWGRRAMRLALARMPGMGAWQLVPDAWHTDPVETSYYREVCKLKLRTGLWARACIHEELAQSAGWWYPHRDFVLLCERPQALHWEYVAPAEHRGRAVVQLHRGDGPAISWSDGFCLYVSHGRQVPGWILETPARITVAGIEEERNVVVRRVMLEQYGWGRYISDCGATVVDSVPSEYPVRGLAGSRLLRKELPGEREPLVFLEMVNSIPDSNGGPRRYLERIDPNAYDGEAARSCHAALASRWFTRDERGVLVRTFQRWQDYQPTSDS